MTVKLNNSGSTLIEILLSIFIIGTTFVLFQASVNTVLLNRGIKNQELALRIAQSEVETLRRISYELIPPSGTFNDPAIPTLPSGQGFITITDAGANTKQAAVSVSWVSPYSGVSHSVVLTTLLTQGGL